MELLDLYQFSFLESPLHLQKSLCKNRSNGPSNNECLAIAALLRAPRCFSAGFKITRNDYSPRRYDAEYNRKTQNFRLFLSQPLARARAILQKGVTEEIGPAGKPSALSKVFSSEEIGSQEFLDCVYPLDFPS